MSLTRYALVAAFSVAPSIAPALTLDCVIKPNASSGGYLTERYVIQSSDGAAEAIVSDALILYYNDNQPTSARVVENTDKKLVVSWKVQLTNKLGQATNMLFRAAYFKGNQTVVIRAVPSGYDNTFEARGRCTPV